MYKERIKNSDTAKGQSGGYRVCYLVIDPDEIKKINMIILLTIYSKSDQADISSKEVRDILEEYFANLEGESDEQ